MSPVSGSKPKRSQDHNERLLEKRYPIVHPKDQSRNWFSDGHRHIQCVCGEGKTSARFYTRQDGRVIPRVVCECDTCGALTVTAGRWRLRGGEWRLVNPKNTRDVPDLLGERVVQLMHAIAHEAKKRAWLKGGIPQGQLGGQAQGRPG